MKYLLLLLVPAMLMLTGCPFAHEKPIEGDIQPVPQWLYGKWKLSGKPAYDATPAQTPANTITVYRLDSTGKRSAHPDDILTVTVSQVDKYVFLNVLEPPNDFGDGGYYIYKLNQQSASAIELLPVKELSDAEKPVRKYLQRNAANMSAYDLDDKLLLEK